LKKEQEKIARALKLEADLMKRLRRLRETKIFRRNKAIIEFRTSEENLQKTALVKKTNRKKKFLGQTVITIQPVATPKKQKRSSMIYKSLEDACERFECCCCDCGQKMTVHAHGIGYPVKIETISAACWSVTCPQRGKEVKFSGEQLIRPESIVASMKEERGVLLRIPQM